MAAGLAAGDEPVHHVGRTHEHHVHAVELIGRRWTASILRALFAGSERFTDIARTVPGLSNRLLTERLEELQESRSAAVLVSL